MFKLKELLYEILDTSNLTVKSQLCREIANYYLKLAKKLEPEIDELYKKRSFAICNFSRLGGIASEKREYKSEAFLYNLGAKFPFLLIFTKQSTLERDLGYSK